MTAFFVLRRIILTSVLPCPPGRKQSCVPKAESDMPEMSKVQCALLMYVCTYVRWRGTRGRPATLSLGLLLDRSSPPDARINHPRARARDPADQTTRPACIETLPHYLFYATLYVRYLHTRTYSTYALG